MSFILAVVGINKYKVNNLNLRCKIIHCVNIVKIDIQKNFSQTATKLNYHQWQK